MITLILVSYLVVKLCEITLIILYNQVFNGTHDTVNFLCDNPDINTLSYVGSNSAGKYIYIYIYIGLSVLLGLLGLCGS